MPLMFDFMLIVFLAPAILLGLLAQWMVKSAFNEMSQVRASTNGLDAARRILDSAGLYNVQIQQVQGHLSDHYDPRDKVLRLSPQVYQGSSMAAVGIAAHEAGHAIQDARNYWPLNIRNLAVPAANFGSSIGSLMAMVGVAMIGLSAAGGFGQVVLLLGIVAFSLTVAFQLVNLPVEFDASSRAKKQLVQLGIVPQQEIQYVAKVLNAAALTYVAATLNAVLTLAYYVFRYLQASRD